MIRRATSARRAGGVAIVATLLLLGCHRVPEFRTIKVEIPVPVPCPEPPALPFPELQIRKLKPDATPEQVARAAVQDLRTLHSSLLQALASLNAYRAERVP